VVGDADDVVSGEPVGDVYFDGDGPGPVVTGLDGGDRTDASRDDGLGGFAGRLGRGGLRVLTGDGGELSLEEAWEAGGEEAGVDGSGDRRVEVELGDDGDADGAFDVSRG
jgi:hypothetical protein